LIGLVNLIFGYGDNMSERKQHLVHHLVEDIMSTMKDASRYLLYAKALELILVISIESVPKIKHAVKARC
jgi:hypothetical protein